MFRPFTAINVIVLVFAIQAASATDWPQFRADAERSGYSPDPLPAKLSLWWVYEAPPPDRAWQGLDTRMEFDHAYHAAVAGGTLFFGSSVDCGIHALDAATRKTRWQHVTDAPVRFAPAVWEDRVFAVSDDGFLYCLAARTGELLWKKRGGPDTDMLLGNGRLVSRRPARGGVAVADGIVYFAAGIWPSEGIYLYALDAATGEPRWLNEDSGGIEMDQPHPTAHAKSGVSVQGYLVVSGGRLIVPTGRAVPAVFDAADGRLLFFHLQDNRALGGSAVMGIDGRFVNNGLLFDTEGLLVEGFRTPALAATPAHVVHWYRDALIATPREALIVDEEGLDRKGKPVVRRVCGQPAWTAEAPAEGVCEAIIAGDSAVLGLIDGEVRVLDMTSKKMAFTTTVDGRPLGLAAADGRLFVSTDTGRIYCFGPKRRRGPATLRLEANAAPYTPSRRVAEAAGEIVRLSGVSEGYCVDLGCGDGQLAFELAQQTKLTVYAVDGDPRNVAAARKKLQAAGLYGSRVTVHCCAPDNTPYPDYFADIVVSGRSMEQGADTLPGAEARRLQRPFGGVACSGAPGAMAKRVRGPLEGAAEWTHQYCNPANTCSSRDGRIKGPLAMLWFRDNDLVMPSRHGRGPAPLFSKGRLFVEGMNALRGVDAYNGRTLWEYPLEGILTPYDQEHLVGTAGTNSNFCMEDDVIYLAQGGKCLRIDAISGEKLGEFAVPAAPDGAPPVWGYIACENGRLFGSVANQDHVVKWAYRKSDMNHLFTESDRFFAMDATSGEVKWTFEPEHSIRHNAIAVAEGRVYLIDRPLAEGDRLDYDAEAAKRRGEAPQGDSGEAAPTRLMALDAETGEVVWDTVEKVYGTLLAVSVEHDVLLMTQQHTRFKLPSERGGRMTALRASTGERLWEAPSDPQRKASRPLLIGRTIYNEPGAWDLLTGKRLDFDLQRSYGCGIMAGSPNLLVYRSATFGYFDLLHNEGTINYGGIRPGCWINAIPAGGLVLAPDATDRCTCSYLIKASIALQPGA
ncbi:MAG: PQQ-binding-like beta-propeller repeat protein [Candidatus Hydrogenedentes bacterium]|nr:PQQ-binding-like beta-propeller repeat protein [Candidatus Hydrogenedentota bacterium]